MNGPHYTTDRSFQSLRGKARVDSFFLEIIIDPSPGCGRFALSTCKDPLNVLYHERADFVTWPRAAEVYPHDLFATGATGRVVL